jgi:four helix bundle protein
VRTKKVLRKIKGDLQIFMQNFRTYNLALDFYRACNKLSSNRGQDYVWKDQFKRASLSILLNIAEESGKPTEKDRRRFYSISMGSLRETQSLLMIAENSQALQKQADQLGGLLYKLIQNPGSLR